MQQAADGIQRFVDARGARWSAVADARDFLEKTVADWIARDGQDAPFVPIKKSKRREVYAAAVAGAPPLLLKRYPPRSGLLGRGRDRIRTRAAAELAMARKLEARGLATPRALGCVEPPGARAPQPSWFVSVRLLGATTLGSWFERRFQPGDGDATKQRVAARALDELARLHAAGIWHRDFHGGNVLLHEGEGPAARLYLIDLHSALDLGLVPARARARDAADFLHSLRYAFSREEIERLVGDAARWRFEPAALRHALEVKREAQARSRGARAFVASSRFAQTSRGGRRVSHDRAIDPDAIDGWLAGHAAALVRVGRRSRLSVQPAASGGRVVVKEFRGRGARAKARGAFAHAVAAQSRDLPVAAPLACVVEEGGAAWLISRAVEDATPLHVVAQRIARDDGERDRAEAIARRVVELLVALVQRRFVHPDLSPKNVLVRERGGETELVLVDLDAARPGARWSRRRIVRALAQLGDVPARALSTPARLRLLAELDRRLGLRVGAAALARATAKKLARRQHLPEQGAPRHDLERLATLHLFGNWKWTGPADPAVALAQALAPEAMLLLGRCPFPDLGQPVADQAAARGVPFVQLDELQKHWNPLLTARAAAAALPIARAHAPAAVHVHLDGDHAAAEALADELPQRPAIVRHVHTAGPHRARTRRLLRRAELRVAPTIGLARELERELGAQELDVAVLETSVDLDRFRFDAARRARARARFELEPTDVAFGIVARIQTHRRYELLFEAWSKLPALARSESEKLGRDAGSPPKLVILGRGTHEEALAREPVARLGLGSLVVLPGYQEGEAYLDALAACDAGIFLVPGSDVSCRAVREWMAMGRAVVATRRPPLPELIDDGVDGRLVAEEADALAAAVWELTSRTKREAAGANALEKARRRFDSRRVRAKARILDRMAAFAVPGTVARFAAAAQTVAAVRPGRLDALLRHVESTGGDASGVVAFDPARSRDAVIDLLALVNAARPQQVFLEPHPEFDGLMAAELRRLAPEVRLLVAPGPGGPDRAHPLVRELELLEL